MQGRRRAPPGLQHQRCPEGQAPDAAQGLPGGRRRRQQRGIPWRWPSTLPVARHGSGQLRSPCGGRQRGHPSTPKRSGIGVPVSDAHIGRIRTPMSLVHGAAASASSAIATRAARSVLADPSMAKNVRRYGLRQQTCRRFTSALTLPRRTMMPIGGPLQTGPSTCTRNWRRSQRGLASRTSNSGEAVPRRPFPAMPMRGGRDPPPRMPNLLPSKLALIHPVTPKRYFQSEEKSGSD